MQDKGVYTFPKRISLKVNVIARFKFRLVYFEVTVQYINDYTTGTTPTLLAMVLSQNLV